MSIQSYLDSSCVNSLDRKAGLFLVASLYLTWPMRASAARVLKGSVVKRSTLPNLCGREGNEESVTIAAAWLVMLETRYNDDNLLRQ